MNIRLERAIEPRRFDCEQWSGFAWRLASSGNTIPANNLLVATNATLSISASATVISLNAASLTFEDNATNSINYGAVSANPSAPAINVTGGLSAPGSNIVIAVAATGLKTGTFTLIKYNGTPPGSLANFQLSPPPGVLAMLVNNTGNDSIDINITQVPNQLAWNGVNGTAWDLSTANWTNTLLGGITVFQQIYQRQRGGRRRRNPRRYPDEQQSSADQYRVELQVLCLPGDFQQFAAI